MARRRSAPPSSSERPLLSPAVVNVHEPLVLSAPPLGRSGDVKVRKPLLDVLCADPGAIGAHVFRIKASFSQGTEGRRSVALRLDLDDEFPTVPVATLAVRLEALQKAGAARCAAVLGEDFNVSSIYFGGKKLR